jgi:hypothetical protein
MKVYRYLTGKDDVNFCARVSKALNDGYELYGSPTMTFKALLTRAQKFTSSLPVK